MSVKKVLYDKELFNSRLEVNIKGKEIDHVIINSLRRIILSEIPTYCWDDFEITTNESIFNNSQLRLSLQNIPVVGVKEIPKKVPRSKENPDEEEEDDELKDIIGIDDIDTEDKAMVDGTSINQMTMFLKYHNDTNKIISVTTDDAKFYYQGEEIKSPYPNPVILIKLQPDQHINFSAKTRLSNEKEDSKFSPVSVCAFKQLKDDESEYLFFLESRGLYTEKELLKEGCYQIRRKLKKLEKLFPETETEEGEIKIPKEDYTVGNLISHGLFLLDEVNYATFTRRHPYDNNVVIRFGLKKSLNIKKLIMKVMDNYNKIFKNLEKEFEKL